MSSIQITGVLKDPIDNIASNTPVRVTTVVGVGETLTSAVATHATDATGVYDFNLVHGSHRIEVRYDDKFVKLGDVAVNDTISGPLTLSQLFMLSVPVSEPIITEMTRILSEANSASDLAALSATAAEQSAQDSGAARDQVVGASAAIIDGYRRSIEDTSGGKNTVIYDEQGNPNIMVRIPRFNYEDVNAAILAKHGIDLQLGEGTPTMFLTDGVPRGEVLIAKYLASSGKNGGCSVVGGVQPRTFVNYDVAKALCENKGANWHMMSIHEWAAIALWSFANDTVPRGNTNYGRSHENKLETAHRADNGTPGDTGGTGRTDTGKGPDTWAHDHSAWGVQDLVGNVWEWIDQMVLKNGQIITTLDNNPSIAEVNWHKHGAYFDSPSDSMSGTGNVGSPILSNSVTKRNGPLDDDSYDYPNMNNSNWAGITQSATYQKIELLRRLLIESEVTNSVTGGIWVRNYGNRFPLRGGDWYIGSGAGLGALYLNGARSISSSSFGFRPTFFAQ